ncbi:MAG TPA: hypothetical protein VFF78_03105, partial [Anaerolineaceae bacterium]|nr:hypothetical protein [Anaerolineaceae bacterium]
VFSISIFKRYLKKRGAHLLLWSSGMLLYATGAFSESAHAAWGWSDLGFRLWYLCGAILVAAWLGQGTIFLLARQKSARILMLILALGSAFAALRVFSAELDPTLMPTSELSGLAILTPGVRTLTPFFNIYGTVALVGGAAYSVWIFWRKHVLLHRVYGNILIAAGGLAPAIGGLLSRAGVPSGLYLSELIGAVLLFAGFLRATTPMIKNLDSSRQDGTSKRRADS